MPRVFIRPHNLNGRQYEVGDSIADLDPSDVAHFSARGIIGEGPTKAKLDEHHAKVAKAAEEAKAKPAPAVSSKSDAKGGK